MEDTFLALIHLGRSGDENGFHPLHFKPTKEKPVTTQAMTAKQFPQE